jgi:uncharacterized protein
MSLEYPDFIDPNKAAEGQRTFSGTIPLSRMERLKPYLCKDSGDARFSAQFDKDSLVGVRIQIEVQAALWLTCQRSLDPYLEHVDRSTVLGVIADISDESLLPDGYEAVLTEHGKLSFLNMVEDELILALPTIPRNPEYAETGMDEESNIESAEAQSSETLQQPFSGLAEQLKQFTSVRGKTPAGKK